MWASTNVRRGACMTITRCPARKADNVVAVPLSRTRASAGLVTVTVLYVARRVPSVSLVAVR